MVHREENFARGVEFVKNKKAGMSSVYGLLVIIMKDIRKRVQWGVATVDQGGMSWVYGLFMCVHVFYLDLYENVYSFLYFPFVYITLILYMGICVFFP